METIWDWLHSSIPQCLFHKGLSCFLSWGTWPGIKQKGRGMSPRSWAILYFYFVKLISFPGTDFHICVQGSVKKTWHRPLAFRRTWSELSLSGPKFSTTTGMVAQFQYYFARLSASCSKSKVETNKDLIAPTRCMAVLELSACSCCCCIQMQPSNHIVCKFIAPLYTWTKMRQSNRIHNTGCPKVFQNHAKRCLALNPRFSLYLIPSEPACARRVTITWIFWLLPLAAPWLEWSWLEFKCWWYIG